MRDGLLPFLLLLTLLDLAFVQATGIVAGQGLLPLWLLTLGAPWLRRLQRWLWCRLTWNLGVLLVFALLVRHATTTGLLHMLEDGLVLAVLCQVHLVNNIGARQRPDLVFFNSLLIAFVTSFFAPDLGWSLLFVAHAFVLVAALQVNVLVRRGAALEAGVVRQVVRHAIAHAVAIGAITALLFVLLPRDFARPGWLGDALGREHGAEAGIADRIRIDDERPTRLGESVVMRLSPASGREADVPHHWRSILFAEFDGAEWSPTAFRTDSRFALDVDWVATGDGSWRRDLGPPVAVVHVQLPDAGDARLPHPLTASALRPPRGQGLSLSTEPSGALLVERLDREQARGLEYAVEIAAGSGRVSLTRAAQDRLTHLPAQNIPRVLHDLATQVRRELPPGASPTTIALASRDWLQQHRRYQLPGEPGFARNLGEFLIGSGAGHCEYFATALALLLRLQGVPCRLVGGYLAHEWDPASASMLVRSRHAHAWVEAIGDDGRWLVLDATPPADVMAPRGEATNWLSASWRQLETMWSDVVGFDGNRRAAWLQRVLDLPGDLAGTAAAHPFPVAATLALGVLLVYRRRRRQHEPAIADLERAVRAAGLSLRNGETPRELLLRAEAAGIATAPLAGLRQAARRHERLRYGPAATRPDRGTPRT
ncbi:MAG: DUF3488 domain-containing protein [Planctomycetes bacterium]|nr:DUF3488 domain-containing protein [Planctomycetota bacterium]